jgi:hypothetical protein
MFKSSKPLLVASLDSHQRLDRLLEGVELSNVSLLSSLSATNDDDD